ncbi:MAG: GIY-YIG nuclease family protein [Filifactoraceae bacterium]
MKIGQQKSSSFYVVYILRCNDNSLYIGITNNLEKRIKMHMLGKGAKYTRGRGPLQCIYFEEKYTKSEALKRENELKKLNKKQKEALVLGGNNVKISKVIYDNYECLKLENKFYQIIVTISAGPRILHFSKNNKANILCNKGKFKQVVDGENWDIIGGHRLWHSPESFPRTYFSDLYPVQYKVLDEKVIFTSKEDKSGIRKDIELSFENDKVRVSHKLTNCGLWRIEMSVWPITILAPSGIAKIPLSNEKTGYLPNRNIVFWDYTQVDDSRIKFENNTLTVKQLSNSSPLKVGTNSNIGRGEYHIDDQIFVKEFETNIREKYPDMGCNIEIYTCDYMLELETTSPLKFVEPGSSIIHDELWSIIQK